uniref:Secreted protein n=1 Tax=Anguilla anguilla TaxID=7936 RepID=A0A0E9XS78_ANGAN
MQVEYRLSFTVVFLSVVQAWAEVYTHCGFLKENFIMDTEQGEHCIFIFLTVSTALNTIVQKKIKKEKKV